MIFFNYHLLKENKTKLGPREKDSMKQRSKNKQIKKERKIWIKINKRQKKINRKRIKKKINRGKNKKQKAHNNKIKKIKKR